MKMTQAGIDLIKEFEGKKNTAYKCPAGVWTICYGATGPDVKEGATWTDLQCEDRLKKDVDKFAEGVKKALGSIPTTDAQFSAMVSLAYNVGIIAFSRSTVLNKHRAGDHKAAANAFLMWNKAGGKILPGLTRRREAERKLYLSGA